jgi:putative membrane protein
MNMKHALSAICCLLVLVVPALAQKAAPMSDQEFINTAAQTDMVEVHLGNLAQDAASSQAVKDYGRMLASDHTQDYQKLQNLAQQAGFTLPTAIDAEHNKSLIAPLHRLNGKVFDHTYIQDMIAGHTAAIALYRKEAQAATNPALRSYAQDTLPALQKHLDAAKAIQQGKTPTM